MNLSLIPAVLFLVIIYFSGDNENVTNQNIPDEVKKITFRKDHDIDFKNVEAAVTKRVKTSFNYSDQTIQKAEKKDADTKENKQKNELELLLEQEMEKPIFDYQEGDVIDANVRLVEKAGVIIDFNYKSDGYIPNAELGFDDNNEIEKLEIGDSVKVFIEKLETKDGYSLLSRKKAQFEESWDELIDAYEQKESVNISIVSKVMGGLVTTYKGIRGFIPASQILLDEGVDMESLVNFFVM